MLMYANDNNKRFPEGLRDNGIEHFSFIHSRVFNYIQTQGGMETNSFNFPNKKDWFRVQTGVGYRLGYYFHWGHRTHQVKRRRDADYGNEPWPWDSPQKATDDPSWPMIGDVIEKGTVNPPITSVPHGSTGPVKSAERIFPEPGEFALTRKSFGPGRWVRPFQETNSNAPPQYDDPVCQYHRLLVNPPYILM